MKWLLLFLVACGDNLSPCDHAMQYGGPTVYCDSLPKEAVCIAYGPELRCRTLCRDQGPACDKGEFWMTMVVNDGPPVCYCEPQPGPDGKIGDL